MASVPNRSDQPGVSVVVPALGNYPVLRQVLDGFSAQTADHATFEVLVVADCAEGDLDAVRIAIGTRGYPVRLLVGTVPGASANRNVGWSAARSPIVLFTDSDTIPVRQFVSEHLAWHRRFPGQEVVIVGPVRWAPSIRVTPFMKWLDGGIQFNFGSIQGECAEWTHVYSANCSIKRAFLERVGGYDEERLPYGYEDLDWGYRARAHRVRVMFNRAAIVDHLRPMTIEHWIARAPRLAVSEWRFCEMHPDVPPWFHQLFANAAQQPPSAGRASAIARYVPRWTPWLGARVWSRADLYWRQQIAPHFLSAWQATAAGRPPELQPSVSAIAERYATAGGDASAERTPVTERSRTPRR